VTPRIARLLDRARHSFNVGWNPMLPPADILDAPVIQAARQQVACWQVQPIAISDDEQLVARPPHLEYREAEPVQHCFGRREWELTFGIELPPRTRRAYNKGYLTYAGNHTTVDYPTILELGFKGLIRRVDDRLARLLIDRPISSEKIDFLHGLRLVAAGYIVFCERYAALASQQAAACADPMRAEELRVIAETCSRVVAEPPRTFREACQALWFSFYFLPDAPGRVDMLLKPYYLRDLESGVLTRETARELLSELWIKYFEFHGAEATVSALHHLTLGGVTAEGADASSDLTDLCLEVTAELKIHRPQVGLRWHPEMPVERVRTAIRTWRAGTGSPDLCNDSQIIPALTRLGVAIEDARDFSLSGCQEVIVSGKAQMGSVEGFLNLPKTLRMALGLELESAELPKTRVTTFEELLIRFELALVWLADHAHAASLARDERAARDPGLTASLVVNDCIEQASGYTQGGARYNFCNWNMIGLSNVVDSLTAIKKLVFDDGVATLDDIRKALANGWNGSETLRRQLGKAPSFGNDTDDVDALAALIITRLDAIFKQHEPYRGGCYILGSTAGGENMHVEFGRVTGATPDGRRDGETMADSIGSAQGRDRHGVTALLNSVAKLPHDLLPTATTLNVKLDPKLLETEDGVALIEQLIRAHFLAGGQHFQVNWVDRDTLLDARAHPERHQNLMVRVAGYSAQFLSLWDDLQEEIISRTMHIA
jgi:pyruvate-formate lyase